MENKKFIQTMKKIIREEIRSVIKEELTDILQLGLQPTINEMKGNQSVISTTNRKSVKQKPKHNMFKENKFSDILNNTELIREDNTISTYASLMSEDINMTSADAMNFGMQRKGTVGASANVTDAETGMQVAVDDPAIAKAMTRDYSALMKAIDNKKKR